MNMRIPGEGTDQLINRRQEAAVYHAIADKTSVTILPILTRRTAIRSQNFWKVPGYATQPTTRMSRSA